MLNLFQNYQTMSKAFSPKNILKQHFDTQLHVEQRHPDGIVPMPSEVRGFQSVLPNTVIVAVSDELT